MPGDEWQQFANLRLLYTYHFTMPGKKLLFMGCEIGQGSEWNDQQGIEWPLLQYPLHAGIKKLVGDLNHTYRSQPALHQGDFDQRHFQWLDCSDRQQSVLSYVRGTNENFVVVILNFTPVVRENYRIGVPTAGTYRVLLNSDSDHYGGSNVGPATLDSEPQPCAGQSNSISVTLPPLAGLVLMRA
jgi:1,4-alpha-glucan branching enzyme